MIKAFRDTWELGIHSYLTYLRDRLMLARELLSESGSVFVQIGRENIHLVRDLLDEVFGSEEFHRIDTIHQDHGDHGGFSPVHIRFYGPLREASRSDEIQATIPRKIGCWFWRVSLHPA